MTARPSGASRRLFALACLHATIGAPVGVLAQAPATPGDYLARYDLDGDGRVALAEYRDYLSRGFRDRDRDGNGVLEGDELPVPGTRAIRLADHLDALARGFARQDHDGDGFLDAAEMAAPPR